MKIILEQADLTEPEITIRGNVSGRQIQNILTLLNTETNFEKMFFFKNDKEYIFNITDVLYFEACKNKVTAHIGKEIYETKNKLYELEEIGRSKGFIRINKGVVVNANCVLSVEPEFSGNYILYMKDSKTQLTISRKYIRDFKKYIMEVL